MRVVGELCTKAVLSVGIELSLYDISGYRIILYIESLKERTVSYR